jgi:hypothetical protein
MTARTMSAIPIIRYPIFPTSLRGATLPAHLTNATAVPRPVSGSQAPHNSLLIKGITGREPARGAKVRKIPDCRDSLHFQARKDYMLNFLRIMKLQLSTA